MRCHDVEVVWLKDFLAKHVDISLVLASPTLVNLVSEVNFFAVEGDGAAFELIVLKHILFGLDVVSLVGHYAV